MKLVPLSRQLAGSEAQRRWAPHVTPAKAGVSKRLRTPLMPVPLRPEIPAFAGMTEGAVP
jgi:hypothetical protein